jgi:zinc protease
MTKFLYQTLPNGLEVCLQSSSFAPLVSLQMQVKVGSLDELPEEAGMAHVLEHMLFKGTKKFPNSGEIATLVERAGGDINAYTTFDHTCYYLTAPSDFWKLGTTMLVDVLSDSLLDTVELERELEVVLEEIKRGRDNPSQIVSRNTFETLFQGNDISRPVIGYEEIVKKFTRENLLKFYKKWYVPENMSFVAVGDFQEKEMLELISELNSNLPNPKIPQRIRNTTEFHLKQPHKNDGEIKIPSKLTFGAFQEARIQMSVLCPSLEEIQAPCWDMFLSVLGNGDTSRLTRAVKEEKQLVTSIDAGCFTPLFSEGFAAVSFYAKQSNCENALVQILNEILNLAKTPPSEAECKRVVSTCLAEKIYAQESVDGLARSASQNLLTSKKLDFENYYTDTLKKVTPKDISNVAKIFLEKLSSGACCVAGAITSEGELSTSEKQEEFQTKILNSISNWLQSKFLAQTINSKNFFVSHQKSLHNSPASHSEIEQFIYRLPFPAPSGIEVHFNFRKSERLPLFSAAIAWQRQAGLESKQFAGIGQMSATMLTRGNASQTYDEFCNELEDKVASIGAFSTKDLVGMRANSLAPDASRIFDLTLESLFQNKFNETQFERVLSETKDVVVAQLDNPGSRLAKLTAPRLYGKHLYSLPTLGTTESLNQMNVNLLQDHWNMQFPFFYTGVCEPENLKNKIVVSAAGSFSKEEIIQKFLESALLFYQKHSGFQESKLKEAQENQFTEIKTPEFFKKTQIAFDVLQREQAQMSLTFRAFPMSEPKRTSLELASQILSGQGGRLFLDLRDKRSLAYSVGCAHTPHMHAGSFQFFIATSAEKTKEAIAGLCEHIQKMCNSTCLEEELARAKSSLLGSVAIDAQHYHVQASQLLMGDVTGLPYDNFCTLKSRIENISVHDVQTAFQEMLAQSGGVLSIVGPEGTFVPSELLL